MPGGRRLRAKPKTTKKRRAGKTTGKWISTSKSSASVYGTAKGSLSRLVTTKNPFPPKKNFKLTYCETFNLYSGTAGVFGTVQKMNLNSLFDPNNSGGGHQPYGYDQVSPLWAKYRVNAVYVYIEFSNPDTDGTVAGVMVQPSTGVGSLAGISADLIREQSTSWVSSAISQSGEQLRKFKQYINISKLEGLTKAQYSGNPNYSALVSTNPSSMPTLMFGVAQDTSTSGAYLNARCEMTFYCTLYDRTLQAYS